MWSKVYGRLGQKGQLLIQNKKRIRRGSEDRLKLEIIFGQHHHVDESSLHNHPYASQLSKDEFA